KMGSVQFGFEGLAHRLRTLGGVPLEIPEARQLSFDRVLKQTFGPNYAEHPRLETLTKLNELTDLDYLSREELTEATRSGAYARMQRSLLRRVRSIVDLFRLFLQGELRHQGTPSAECPLRSISAKGSRRSARRSRQVTESTEGNDPVSP